MCHSSKVLYLTNTNSKNTKRPCTRHHNMSIRMRTWVKDKGYACLVVSLFIYLFLIFFSSVALFAYSLYIWVAPLFYQALLIYSHLTSPGEEKKRQYKMMLRTRKIIKTTAGHTLIITQTCNRKDPDSVWPTQLCGGRLGGFRFIFS